MKPWGALPDSAPYVLPMDAAEIKLFNRRVQPIQRLHLDLMPEPFLGNPLAPVVLLNGNPGFSEADPATHRDIEFRAAARRNLFHSHPNWPLYLLDPSL